MNHECPCGIHRNDCDYHKPEPTVTLCAEYQIICSHYLDRNDMMYGDNPTKFYCGAQVYMTLKAHSYLDLGAKLNGRPLTQYTFVPDKLNEDTGSFNV